MHHNETSREDSTCQEWYAIWIMEGNSARMVICGHVGSGQFGRLLGMSIMRRQMAGHLGSQGWQLVRRMTILR